MNLGIAPVSILLYFNLYFTCGQQFWNSGCPWVMIGTKISTVPGHKTQCHMTASLSNNSPGSSNCHCSWKTAWVIKWVPHTTSYETKESKLCIRKWSRKLKFHIRTKMYSSDEIWQELKLTVCSLFITWTLDSDSKIWWSNTS